MELTSRVMERIDALSARYLDILEKACCLESPTKSKAAVDAVGEYFCALARERGWEVEVFLQEVAGNVVCITANGAASAAPVSMSGHIDTVHPIGSFGSPAVRRDGEKMYGPGVLDCKGGVVAAFLAMEALLAEGYAARPLRLLLQSDEEVGSSISGRATIRHICEKAVDSVAFFNMEGFEGGTAVLRRKGILRFRFDVRGRACHSSLCHKGANAVAEAAHKLLALEKMKDSEGLTCNCGVISGGTVANTVAEECSFLADIRFATEEEERVARETVRRVAEESVIGGCSCELVEVSYRPAMLPSEKNDALLARMNESYAAAGLPTLSVRFSRGGSDAAYTTAHGIPTVDSLGTEGGKIHSTDEYIYLSSLAESAKRVAVAICGL